MESYIASVLPKYKLDASVMAAINADADSGVIDDERTFDTNTYGNGVFDADGRPAHLRADDDETTPTPPSGATDRSPNRNRLTGAVARPSVAALARMCPPRLRHRAHPLWWNHGAAYGIIMVLPAAELWTIEESSADANICSCGAVFRKTPG